MEIVHISAECYPVAKAGGLADVVGALPRFQKELGHVTKVIMPMYRTDFLYKNEWQVVHKGGANLGHSWFDFTVIKEVSNKLDFELYLLDINGLLDREKIYGYDDDTERFCAFQIAVLSWMNTWNLLPNVIHVHDHHTALIPFMVKYCYGFGRLSGIPTVLTIHNAEYQGSFGWNKTNYIPQWDSWKRGMLEWNGNINPLASGVKCAWKVTTVSNTYLNEMRFKSNGMEPVFEYEKGKCSGIINGIDYGVWDPENDKYLNDHYNVHSIERGKGKSKKILCETFGLSYDKPLFVFIGRLVGEKAADLLPQVINDCFRFIGRKMNFLILGSGNSNIEAKLIDLKKISQGDYNVYVGYNEKLSHLMYAGADFLLMPSRVEPCGLNQMYAMRYGTIPIVRRTGGLIDTVIDMGNQDGYGITFNEASVGDISNAIYRALDLYSQKDLFRILQKKAMSLDFSWHNSAKQYLDLYQNLQ
jgi:starch synthase